MLSMIFICHKFSSGLIFTRSSSPEVSACGFLLKLKVDREIARFPACARISIRERGDSDLIVGNDELQLLEKMARDLPCQ